jgi:glyoxylase I family protein
MPGIDGFAHVTLSVRDHDHSVGWYGEVLGFQPVMSETTGRWRRTGCVHPGSGTILVLHQHLASHGDEFDERRTGLDHLSFQVTDYDALLAWQERLSALGVPHSPITEAVRGGLVISFRDPDRIALELFCRRQPPPESG